MLPGLLVSRLRGNDVVGSREVVSGLILIFGKSFDTFADKVFDADTVCLSVIVE